MWGYMCQDFAMDMSPFWWAWNFLVPSSNPKKCVCRCMQKVHSSRPTKKLSRQVIHAYCKMPDKGHTGIDFSTLLKTPLKEEVPVSFFA